jgi:uncharacterized protein (TIGR00369 family)
MTATDVERPIEQSSARLLAEASTRSDGLAFLEAIRDGELPPPPIAELLGFRIHDLRPGAVTFALDPAEKHYNPLGMVHGGVAATLLDTVMACAVQSQLPAGVGYTTLDLNVRYVRPVTVETGTVLATGKVLHLGRRTATAEAELTAAHSGALLAHSTSTLLVLS